MTKDHVYSIWYVSSCFYNQQDVYILINTNYSDDQKNQTSPKKQQMRFIKL